MKVEIAACLCSRTVFRPDSPASNVPRRQKPKTSLADSLLDIELFEKMARMAES